MPIHDQFYYQALSETMTGDEWDRYINTMLEREKTAKLRAAAATYPIWRSLCKHKFAKLDRRSESRRTRESHDVRERAHRAILALSNNIGGSGSTGSGSGSTSTGDGQRDANQKM